MKQVAEPPCISCPESLLESLLPPPPPSFLSCLLKTLWKGVGWNLPQISHSQSYTALTNVQAWDSRNTVHLLLHIAFKMGYLSSWILHTYLSRDTPYRFDKCFQQICFLVCEEAWTKCLSLISKLMLAMPVIISWFFIVVLFHRVGWDNRIARNISFSGKKLHKLGKWWECALLSLELINNNYDSNDQLLTWEV